MQRKSLAVILLGLVLATTADAGVFRIGATAGFGNNTAKGAGPSVTDEPLGFAFFGDYALTSRIAVGAEHVRSLHLTPLSTGVSYTGLTGKWYFLRPHPSVTADRDNVFVSIRQVAFTPYLGAGFGFAQATIIGPSPNPDTNVIAFYMSAKLGVEVPAASRWGFRFEASYSRTILGGGWIQGINALVGAYVFF